MRATPRRIPSPSPCVLVLLLAALAACSGSGDTPPPETLPVTGDAPSVVAEPQEDFVGTIVYEAKAGGTNTESAELFNAMGPKRESVTWGGEGRLRITSEGGLMEGITVARFADSAFFILDTVARTAKEVYAHSMNPDDAVPEMRDWMASRYGPAEMEATDEERTVAGRRCRMYVFRRSGMLRRGATGKACVAEDLRVPMTRYNFSGAQDGSESMVTLPLQYGIREGLPLLVEVNEAEAIVTYTAVSITPGNPADSLFSVPAGYTVTKRQGS